MYCANCGSESTADASFCAKCGSRIAPNASTTASSSPPAQEAKPAIKKSLYGVGGWLGLLVVGLTVLGPILGAVRLSQAFMEAESKTPQLASYAPWASYKTDVLVIFAVAALISFGVGVLLFRFRRSSVRATICALWIIGPIKGLSDIVAANTSFTGEVASEMAQAMWPSVIAAGIAAAIWTAYLLVSKRVKNTYYDKPV